MTRVQRGQKDVYTVETKGPSVGRKERDGDTRLVTFEFGRSHYGYYSLVERNSVLAAFMRRRRDGKALSVEAQVQKVIQIYRRVLLALQGAKKLSDIKARELGNCRPAFVVVKPLTHSCHRPSICPACWGRRAAAVWRRIDLATFPQREDGTRPRRVDYDLVVARRTFSPAMLAPYKGAAAFVDLGAALADRVVDRKFGPLSVMPGRKYEMRQLYPVGALDVMTVEMRNREPFGWQISLRQVFVVQPGRKFALLGATMKRIESPTRKQVAKSVAWAWRYPRSLLLDGREPASPHVVAGYLKACKGRRMWATYGVFNEGRPWDKELHAAAKRRAAENRAAKKAARFP